MIVKPTGVGLGDHLGAQHQQRPCPRTCEIRKRLKRVNFAESQRRDGQPAPRFRDGFFRHI